MVIYIIFIYLRLKKKKNFFWGRGNVLVVTQVRHCKNGIKLNKIITFSRKLRNKYNEKSIFFS